ncbi:MAG TPA: hypothetical protein VF653_08895 [Methylomirabilota bacterium]
MNPREYSTRARPAFAPARVADVLHAAAHLQADGRGRFLAPASLQSWPGIVHGGGLAALLDAASRALAPDDRPRRIEARLTSSVPIDRALDLEGHAQDSAVTVTILERGQPLTSATITAADQSAAALDAGDGAASIDPAAGREPESWPMPLSDQCLACGADNPLGLRLGLRFDARSVWARFVPRDPWQRPDGRLEPALAAVILDEVAWWLGALVSQEGGLTNRIDLVMRRPDSAVSGPLLAAGRLDAVAPVDRRRTFWRTHSALLTGDGSVLATAAIVFRAGADYSARQMAYFRSRTDPAVFARMFPAYAGS